MISGAIRSHAASLFTGTVAQSKSASYSLTACKAFGIP